MGNRRQLVAWVALSSVAVALRAEIIPQTSAFPDANIEITVRQKEDGQISRGLHVLHLYCSSGECSLTWLTLNQCYPSGNGKPAFYPKIQRVSTRDGTLKVTREANFLVVQELGVDIGGSYTTKLRFGVRPVAPGQTISTVTSFSGAYVKDSTLLKRFPSTEYVALEGSMQAIPLDCAFARYCKTLSRRPKWMQRMNRVGWVFLPLFLFACQSALTPISPRLQNQDSAN
jgi:hypothetical protein